MVYCIAAPSKSPLVSVKLQKLSAASRLRPSYSPHRRAICKYWQAFSAQEVYQIADIFAVGTNVIGFGLGTSILGALSWSALPLISGQSQRSTRRSVDEGDAVSVKWGVMTVLSFLPLFNWLAWIFAALEDSDRASFYYILAFLYGIPQLGAGFDQNWFSIATIVAGILHVQAERIADEKGIANTLALDSSLEKKPEEATKLLKDTARSFAEAIQNRVDSDSNEEEEPDQSSSEELRRWDRRFKDKETR